jgi:hypothetical protein
MISANNPALVADLRFALDVLDERSHLGLDSEYHSRIRFLLLAEIKDAEAKRPLTSTGELIRV